ncbi:hypothetical protein SUDANB95_05525 [Actinosynnema sp. ALI-1.44]
MAPEWTYTVHDLLTNVQLTELPLTGVGYSLVLNDAGEMSGSFRVDPRSSPKRRVRDPYDATMPCRRAVYAWRDGVPQWGGIIWTRRYDSDTGVVEIQCADWWSYFDHRKVLPLLSFPISVEFEIAELVASQSNVDQNAIARYLVTLAQSHTQGNIGIVADTTTSGITRTRNWYGFELQDTGEALRQLSRVLNGPDIHFGVSPSLDANGRPVRTMRTGDPMLGQQGSAWVWEYGANVTRYTWPSDGSRYRKRVFAVGKGIEQGIPIAATQDDTRPAWPLIEGEYGYSSVSEPSTLQAHADSDQIAARLPVVLPTLTVRGDRSPRIGEWSVGDDGRVIIGDDFMPHTIETSMRIVRADVTPAGDDADESVTFVMAPLLEDVA